MIEYTKQAVESTFNTDNGYENDAEVIYGDTDSVMVKFGCKDLAQAMKLGKHLLYLIKARAKEPVQVHKRQSKSQLVLSSLSSSSLRRFTIHIYLSARNVTLVYIGQSQRSTIRWMRKVSR